MNYYEVLGCSPSATYDQLKKSYQKLAKETHPDKTRLETSNFSKIDKAWKVLRDETQRKIYDSSLLQKNLQQNNVIYAEISLKSLNFNKDSVAYYPCRCGEKIVIYKSDITDSAKGDETLFECTECSNNISVSN